MEKRSVVQQPVNPVATFVDNYGELRVIHRKQGRRLSVFNGGDTPALRMNRAAAILIGKNIKAKRLEHKMSQKLLCQKAGLVNVNPKQCIHSLENAKRQGGSRMGTLYAIAFALECEVSELLPSVEAVLEYAEMDTRKVSVLA